MDANGLFIAITRRDQASVERILAADPLSAGAVDANGVSALLTAVYHGNEAAVTALRATGRELDVFEAAAVGDLDRVRALVEADPSLARAYAPDGFHALGLAAFFKHGAIVRLLLAAGADARAASRNAMGVTALHSAVADGGDRETVDALIAAGADVNAVQSDGFVPLHAAAQTGSDGVAEALLAAGADPSAANDAGKTAADIARDHGHEELARRLEGAATAR
jgi:ankyrin repeat protein